MIIRELVAEIKQLADDGNAFCLLPETFNTALVGYCHDVACMGFRVVYSRLGVLHALMADNPEWGMDDAVEWFDHNIAPRYAAPSPPIYLDSQVS